MTRERKAEVKRAGQGGEMYLYRSCSSDGVQAAVSDDGNRQNVIRNNAS